MNKKVKVNAYFRGILPFIGRSPVKGVEIDENQFQLLKNKGYPVFLAEEVPPVSIKPVEEVLSSLIKEKNETVIETAVVSTEEITTESVETSNVEVETSVDESKEDEVQSEPVAEVLTKESLEAKDLDELKAMVLDKFPGIEVPPASGKKWAIKKLLA